MARTASNATGRAGLKEQRSRSRRFRSRVAAGLATLFAVIAWLCALLALVPLLRSRAQHLQVAAEYLAIPIRPNLAYAAFLGLLAASLRRRTRVSWWIVVVFYFGPSFVGSAVAGFTEPPLFVSAGILLVLLGLTVAARREFTARLEPGNGWRALATLVVNLTVASVLGAFLVWVFPGTVQSDGDRVTWAIDHVLGGLGTTASATFPGRPHQS